MTNADRRNEIRKLYANLFNTVSAAVLIFGTISPFFRIIFESGSMNMILDGSNIVQISYIIGVLVATGLLHFLGRNVLLDLE
jgi:hypothetical protein